MKRSCLFPIAFALLSYFPLAQSAITATGTISGIILDDATNDGLDYVNVVLYNKNSAIPLKGIASIEDGSFKFENISSGEYRIEGTFVGYIPWSKDITLSDGQHVRLGTIVMKADAKLLGAAEVTGIRSAMRFEIDKRVFSVDQTIAAAGASASDILKDIPSVEVDEEGTVSLRNSSDVTIWMNGKPAGLTSDNQGQILEQLPAESIDRIEVITNPSSKFSAEGTAGIINIILKKDRKAGYYGSLRAGISHPFGYNFGGNFNYSSPKIDFYANIGRRVNTNEGNGSSSRQTFIPDTSWLISDSKRAFDMQGLFFRSGIDYHLSDKHTISLSGLSMDGDRNFENNIDYDYLDKNRVLTQHVLRNTLNDGGHSHVEIMLDYQWEIGEEHLFKTNLTYGNHSNMNDNLFTQTYFAPSGLPIDTINQVQTGPSEHKDWEFQADYSRKLSDKYRIEAGLKSDWTRRGSNDNIYNSASLDQPGLPVYSNVFDYDEKIHALYGTFTGKVGSGFGYQLGLRGELTDIMFTSANRLSSVLIDHDKNYFNLFPSVFLTYSFSEGQDLQLNYSRRIQRPRGRNLNPFSDITDSTNIRFGNPDLEPVFSNALELNYIKAWDNHSLSASLYHQKAQNVFQQIHYLENGVMYQTPSNVTRSVSSGLEIVSKNSLTNWAEITSTVNGYYTQMDGFTYRNIAYEGNSGFSWNGRLNGTFILSKTLTGQVSGFYYAPRIISQGKTKSNYSLDAGLRKSFFNRKLLVAINAQNLLNSFKFAHSNWGEGFYQESSNQFRQRRIQLSFTWNFGNLKPKERPEQQNGNGNGNDDGDVLDIGTDF